MEQIITVTEPKWETVRFVKSIRKGLFGSKVLYTTNINDALVVGKKDRLNIELAVKRECPAADIETTDRGIFIQDNVLHRFYVIAGSLGFRNDGLYEGVSRKNRHTFSSDINRAQVYMSKMLAEDTIRVLRQVRGMRVYTHSVYIKSMNNVMADKSFVMVCVDKKDKGKMAYYRTDKEAISLTSDPAQAKTFSYDDAVSEFERLRQKDKRYRYAVIRLDDAVPSAQLPQHIKSGGIKRAFKAFFCLNNIKIKE